MKFSFFAKAEKTKPSDPKAGIVGFMLGWEWEAVTAKLANLFKRKPKAKSLEDVSEEKQTERKA